VRAVRLFPTHPPDRRERNPKTFFTVPRRRRHRRPIRGPLAGRTPPNNGRTEDPLSHRPAGTRRSVERARTGRGGGGGRSTQVLAPNLRAVG